MANWIPFWSNQCMGLCMLINDLAIIIAVSITSRILQSFFIHLFLYLILRALSVIIYLVFLFLVVIVLLNVLIAQVSDTYSKVLFTAEGVYLYRRCCYIIRLEKQLRGVILRIDSSQRRCIPGVRKRVCICVFTYLLFLDVLLVVTLQVVVS